MRGDRWSKEWGQNRTLCVVGGSLSSQFKNTKAESYSEVTVWSMIQDQTEFTEQGSSASQMTAVKVMDVISRLPGCSGPAADAVSAYTHVKMEDAPIENSKIRMSRYLGTSTNGQNHGPAWKTQCFFWNKICTVIPWQDYCGNGNLRKFYLSTVGKKFRIGNVYSGNGKKKDHSYLYVDVFFCPERTITEMCSKPKFLLELQKIYFILRNLAQTFPRGPMTWMVMPRNAWRDIAKLQIKRLHNYTKSQRHAWMTINLMKIKMDQGENCPQFARKLFWHVCIWLVLVDLVFCRLWTNLLVRSQNGQKRVTNDYLFWSLTFITHVNTDNIIMWETRHKNAD